MSARIERLPVWNEPPVKFCVGGKRAGIVEVKVVAQCWKSDAGQSAWILECASRVGTSRSLQRVCWLIESLDRQVISLCAPPASGLTSYASHNAAWSTFCRSTRMPIFPSRHMPLIPEYALPLTVGIKTIGKDLDTTKCLQTLLYCSSLPAQRYRNDPLWGG